MVNCGVDAEVSSYSNKRSNLEAAILITRQIVGVEKVLNRRRVRYAVEDINENIVSKKFP